MRVDSSNRMVIHLSNIGLKKEAMKELPIDVYKSTSTVPLGLVIDCLIDLAEFREWEKVKVFPNYNHAFQMRCIQK